MNNKPLVIVIVLMLLGFAAFGAIYYKKHHATPGVAGTVTQPADTLAAQSTPNTTASGQTYTPPPVAAQNLSASPVFYLQQQMKGLQNGVTAALNKRKITLADFEKLYFGGSDAPDPAYAVFNPDGKIAFKPANGKWIGQDLIDKIAKEKGTKLVYNLRRVKDAKGGVTDILYAIIPNVDAANCGMAAGNEQYAYAGEFKVAKNNNVIVEDPADMPIMKIGCIMDSTHAQTWVYRLKLRTITGSQKIWGSY
jgi:hypothetical protein